MSGTDDEATAPHEVIDEEGSVDKAIKRRIIKARERVDETEIALYRDAAIEPDVRISEVEKVHIYATMVKQFLRRIEPLFRVDGVPNNKHYYKEIEIAEFTLFPPETDGYNFPLVARDHSDKRLRRMIGLPSGVDLPKPKTVTIKGLQEVIDRQPAIRKQWEVCVNNNGAPPNYEYVYPTVERPLSKDVYEKAIRKADLFLQEAGIGLETDTKGSEIIRNFDMSGETPQAEYGTAEYQGNPDL